MENNVVTDGTGILKQSTFNQATRHVPVAKPTQNTDKLKQRLNTYSKWSSRKSAIQLATAGFVYTGITDKVECQSCGIRLYNWQDDENPLEAHKKYAPDCKFMLENFPHVEAPPKPKKILTVKYPTYSNYQERLKSFDSWPLKCVAQKPEIMAKSGFFYIGSADRARCFHCGVTLRDWDTDDYPPCAHRQWSENCPFVQKLNVEGIKAEIEELERIEKFKQEARHSHFFDCSSSRKRTLNYGDVVTDGACGGTSSTQVHSQVSDLSTDGLGFNPAVQAVIEMGYSYELVEKALEVRRKEGVTNPNAVSIFEAIMDME